MNTALRLLTPVSCTLTEDMIQPIGNQTYKGEAIRPVVLKYGDYTLIEDTDYRIGYALNVEAGTSAVEITAIGDFWKGYLTTEFTIEKATPEVTPVIPEGEYIVGDELPEIGYESSISGIIQWMTELADGLIEGKNVAEWQFTPENENYNKEESYAALQEAIEAI